MMRMGVQRLSALIAMTFAVSGLNRVAFDHLPLFGPFPARPRGTLDRYHANIRKGRYTGAMLRQIRATGQARECARRRARFAAA